MESLQLSHSLRIAIDEDENRVIAFNPMDTVFVEKFYQLMQNFESKRAEYQKRAEELDADKAMDQFDIPENMGARIAYLKELCEFMFAEIDRVFGNGSSEKVFQGQYDLDMIRVFFEGIAPFVQKARAERMQKFMPPAKTGKKVMH